MLTVRNAIFSLCVFICSTLQAQVCLVRSEPDPALGGGACGSGFFISANQILTANHVIEGQESIRVEYNNMIHKATVIKQDKYKDLALLQVNFNSQKMFKIGKKNCSPDDSVTCKGHPKGTWSVHRSIGKIKSIIKARLSIHPPGSECIYYNASMSVTEGMSGGPLLDKGNRVVGVLSTKSVSGPPEANFVSLPEILEFLK